MHNHLICKFLLDVMVIVQVIFGWCKMHLIPTCVPQHLIWSTNLCCIPEDRTACMFDPGGWKAPSDLDTQSVLKFSVGWNTLCRSGRCDASAVAEAYRMQQSSCACSLAGSDLEIDNLLTCRKWHFLSRWATRLTQSIQSWFLSLLVLSLTCYTSLSLSVVGF